MSCTYILSEQAQRQCRGGYLRVSDESSDTVSSCYLADGDSHRNTSSKSNDISPSFDTRTLNSHCYAIRTPTQQNVCIFPAAITSTSFAHTHVATTRKPTTVPCLEYGQGKSIICPSCAGLTYPQNKDDATVCLGSHELRHEHGPNFFRPFGAVSNGVLGANFTSALAIYNVR